MPASERARRHRRRRTNRPAEDLDLFPMLIDRLADDLCALPPDAWDAATGGGAVASLAERLAALHLVRTKHTEEEP
jgi:hypothetical protein